MMNERGEEIPASIFSKVVYNLHESFGARAKQGKSTVTFSCLCLRYVLMQGSYHITTVQDPGGRMGRVRHEHRVHGKGEGRRTSDSA